MSNKNIEQIIKQLRDHEKRIYTLERGPADQAKKSFTSRKKAITLPELIRKKHFKSGQEKVATIIGYYEKIEKKQLINEAEVKRGWKDGKFNGKYDSNLLSRAIGKDGLVRKIDGNLDLSQSGEDFFDNFLKPDDKKS